MCWANRLFIIMIAALGLMSLLNACGSKGALTLPETTTKHQEEKI